jgi:hypothetical protein
MATGGAAAEADAFEKAKRLFVIAAVAIAGGLAVAGSIDTKTGGVLVVAGWFVAVAALHRLGRAGSSRAPKDAEKPKAKAKPKAEPEPEPKADAEANEDDEERRE